ADGGTSLDMVGRVLGDVRARCPSRTIRMTYTDLPRTDYSALFQLVHGLSGPPTYASAIPDLYVDASATSFHRQIVPAGTLDLGHSATASHYITEAPAAIENHVHMVRAEGPVRDAYRAKGAKDWENFLLMRARELKPGGFLALFNFGIDEEGRWLGDTGGASMFDTFAALWRAMADEGAITGDEFRATNFPQVYRTVDEFTAPLAAGPARDADLTLEHVETRVVACPFAAAHARGDYADAAAFAKAYVPTLRSWSEPVFLAGLSSDRPVEERAALVDEFYGRYEALVAADPTGHGMDYVHCYLICRKG
ncbi:MAG: SAM-dependent methyltransferase, partial [Pseudomonadota bacterium]